MSTEIKQGGNKLKRRERKVFRKSFYANLATLLEGPVGRNMLQVMASRPAESDLQAELFEEYAKDLLAEVVSNFRALAKEHADNAEADGSTYDHPDTPRAHGPDTGADA